MPLQQSKAEKITELTTTLEFDSLLSQELTVIFKHSTTCPISHFAHREVTRFCEKDGATPVYLISVRRQREVARYIAQRTGVQHESPQVVILRRGEVLGAASHDEITAEWIASAIASRTTRH